MRRRTWTMSVFAGLAGTVLGLGATIVPVIAPRRADVVPTPTLHADQVSGTQRVTAGWSSVVQAPANLVGVKWQGDPAARFAVEARDASGRWQAITEVGFESDHRPDAGTLEASRALTTPASEPVWVGDARAVRVRLTRGSASRVTVERVRSPRAAASSNVAGAASVAMPGIISRAEWGADENLRLANCPEPPDISTNVTIAVVHHTGGNNNYGPRNTRDRARLVRLRDPDAALLRHALQLLHRPLRPDLRRPLREVWDPVRAAHATGMNTGSVGVALIGNFQSAPVPAAAITALESLLAWKLNWHGVDPTRSVDYTTISGTDRWPAGSTHTLPYIVGHRDPGQTDCPGDNVYALLPKIRLAVASRILNGGADGIYAHFVAPTKPKIAVLSAYGVVYPAGGAGEFRASGVWPGWAIARDIEMAWRRGRRVHARRFRRSPPLRVLGADDRWPVLVRLRHRA